MRRLVAMSIVLCALVPMGSGPIVRADVSDAQQAAEEIAEARERANAAADAYFEAESLLDELEVEAQELESEIIDLEQEVAALRDRVQEVAVNRFTRSSSGGSPLLNGFSNAEEQMQVATFMEVINDTSAEDFDEFDSLNRELEQKNDELAAKHSETQTQRATAISLRDQAIAEVENLKDVEAERLQDEAVRAALAAEERTRAAKAAREEAEQQTQPTTTVEFDDIDSPSDVSATPMGAQVGSGGQTGGGGTGGRPGGAGGADYAQAGWVCPTGTAPVGFGDTWGAPRSGGRQHQGVDMIGARGTPILAVVDGFAIAAEGRLGGLTVRLIGVDGNRYFYGHFDSYGQLGDVLAGDVIGLMGDTGNAKQSTPHLHFEIHPGGGAAVNPYPTVRAHC